MAAASTLMARGFGFAGEGDAVALLHLAIVCLHVLH